MFEWRKKRAQPPSEPSAKFPPVPDWQPSIVQPLESIEDRVRYYTDGKRDFALFANGTFVLLPVGLSEAQAEAFALAALDEVFHAHPDMRPVAMDDGNILIGYKNDITANVVLSDVVAANWTEIEAQHQRALAKHEVLMTPLGQNKFDAFGIKALFGRCFMFMDAQRPRVLKVVRHAT